MLMTLDGVKEDDDGNKSYSYQWQADGQDIPGAQFHGHGQGVHGPCQRRWKDDLSRDFVLRRCSPTRVPNQRRHLEIAGSPGEISRIEPGIRGITVSGGDTVICRSTSTVCRT